MEKNSSFFICAAICFVTIFIHTAFADDISVIAQDKKVVKKAFQKPGYSLYGERNFPTKAPFGAIPTCCETR